MAGGQQNLTILCVTNGQGDHVREFVQTMQDQADHLGACFMIGADGEEAYRLSYFADRVAPINSMGYLESVLDEVTKLVDTPYVLRLDDDERMSQSLLWWLKSGEYTRYDIVTFPRANLWGDREHFLKEEPWWMDAQTRLGKVEKMLGRDRIHKGNPAGSGITVPYAIEHHKFLVRDYAERLKIAEQYEKVQPGAGKGEYLPYNLPEDTGRKLLLANLGSGMGFKA